MTNLSDGFFHPYHHRKLYDQKFLDAGCVSAQGVELNEQNGVDSSTATFATNYIVAAVALVVATLLFRKPDKEHVGTCVCLYFLCSGLSYGIAGIAHQLSQEQEEVLNQYLLRVVAFFANVGTSSLFRVLLLFNMQLHGLPNLLWWLLSVPVTVYAVFVAVHMPGATGIPGLLVVLTAIFQHLRQWVKGGSKAIGMKATAFVVLLIGGVLQMKWAPVCGFDAYPDCFRHCPLPAPKFNHNALFHIFAIVFFVMYGLGEVLHPAQECLQILRPPTTGNENNPTSNRGNGVPSEIQLPLGKDVA